MISEPYICTKGPRAGEIHTFDEEYHPETRTFPEAVFSIRNSTWQPYADFEREKLREINPNAIILVTGNGYEVNVLGGRSSGYLIDYGLGNYRNDSESSRLIKRAEFLKAVCEKEGVEFLPVTKRFHELDGDERAKARMEFGIDLGKPDGDKARVWQVVCQCFRVCNGEMMQTNPRCSIHGEPERDYDAKTLEKKLEEVITFLWEYTQRHPTNKWHHRLSDLLYPSRKK